MLKSSFIGKAGKMKEYFLFHFIPMEPMNEVKANLPKFGL
ncbi:hypothetical protein PEDI_03380 [Persicobacter diffluens]|uniref:Uncharacterized protein n=1 Tax=Persicobacter diffluens TaxID=981 RepID=A0AAN5AJT3_9BACT|nr:hypothetical protein PEDI_03380 [Persicobacter diffluens]